MSRIASLAFAAAALSGVAANAQTAPAAQPAPGAQAAPAARPPPAPVKGIPLKPARLPDGHPNWTGFWVPPGGFLEVYRGPSGVTGANFGPNANTPRGRASLAIVLKSPYKEQYVETQRKLLANELPDMLALCFPPGMPRMMGAIYGIEILQTPNIISITSEWQAENRRIWMDLKAHPPLEELDPTYAGHSIGHWEGDTLVVDTVGVREDMPIDQVWTPHSANMHMIERFTQTSPGVLTDEITMLDPDVTDTVQKQTHVYRYRPDLRLEEYNCLENNRNVDPATGHAIFQSK
jgi:hypothetical protein